MQKVLGITKLLKDLGIERLEKINNETHQNRRRMLQGVAATGIAFGYLKWSDTEALLTQAEAYYVIRDSFRRVSQRLIKQAKQA